MVSKCNGSYLYQSHQPLLVRNISESVYYHPKVKFLCNYIHNFLKSTLYQMYAMWRRNKVIYDQTMQILTQRFLSVSVAQSRPTLCDPMDCMQPTRLFCPWNSPDKNTRVGNHSLLPGAWNQILNIFKIIFKIVTCSTSRDLTKLEVMGWGWEWEKTL